VRDGALEATGADGETARVTLPFDRPYAGPADLDLLLASAPPTARWGVLLVRKGGFAVAAGTGRGPAVTKVGQRHVQGRTKAGGQSQQRFARRRDNQAREAYAAAADHAHRVLVTELGGVDALVCGGDRTAVDAVLSDRRLAAVAGVRCGPWLDVPDPRRGVLDSAVAAAHSFTVELHPADPTEPTDPTARERSAEGR
jgi:hypothetical protein